MEVARQGLQLMPGDTAGRMNFALYSCYATDFQSCEREARHVLQLNPKYEEAFLVLAYSQLGQGQLDKAAQTYQTLAKMSPWGASMAASGLGDLALYRGDFQQGAQILDKGAAQDRGQGKADGAADKLMMLANADLQRGQKQPAIAAAQRALALSQSAKTRYLAARVFVGAGAVEQAQKLATALGAEIQASPQAYAKVILGDIAVSEHRPNEAIQRLTEANKITDSWLGHFDLGRAYIDAGAFAEADSELDQCMKRRGEVLELFMDDVPTFSYLPAVYYYQGRDREGLRSPGFVNFYQTYLSIRGHSTEDPLLADIRSRMAHAS
jgi:tetratricopeptide (TPR) repeat protein